MARAASAALMRCSNGVASPARDRRRRCPHRPSTSARAGGRPCHDSAEPDHHRHAARARQHRDMRGRRARREHDRATRSSPRRGSAEGEMSSPATIEPPGSPRSCPAGQVRQHAVANIGEIGDAGTEIFVFRRSDSQRSRHRAPSARRRRQECPPRSRRMPPPPVPRPPASRPGRRRMSAASPSLRPTSVGQLCRRAFDRRLQRRGLLRGIARSTAAARARRRQNGDRADGKARRRGTTGEADLGHRLSASPKPSWTSASMRGERRLPSGPATRK